jgi:hypothetical protein
MDATDENIPKQNCKCSGKGCRNAPTALLKINYINKVGHNDEKNINQKIGTQSISNKVVDDRSSDRTIQIEDVRSKRQTKSDSGECPRCQELKEALKKATNLSTVDTIPTTANNSDKADLKTASKFLNELSLPSRELHRYVASQRKKGKNEVWLTIKTNLTTGKIVHVKTGRNLELLGRNSFEVEYD